VENRQNGLPQVGDSKGLIPATFVFTGLGCGKNTY
jgi:hypothetical protein